VKFFYKFVNSEAIKTVERNCVASDRLYLKGIIYL
jgi:hypothetical protein